MTFPALHTVADHLPFHLDDTTQVNEVFLRWHRKGEERDQYVIDLWTYCYVYRYFLIKFAPGRRDAPLCLDQLVARAFASVQKHRAGIRQPDSYAGWVGTICKHAFVNYLRNRRSTVSLDEEAPLLVVAAPEAIRHHDAVIVHRTIADAIEALPAFLRDVTRLRLLERRSYESISSETGKTPATLRAYLNKALGLLRRNETLCTLLQEMRD